MKRKPWDHDTSFHYWNQRYWAAARQADEESKGWTPIECSRHSLRARAYVEQKTANDSRIDPGLRRHCRSDAKKMFAHLDGNCPGKKPYVNRHGFPINRCDHCDHEDRLMEVVTRLTKTPKRKKKNG